MNNVFLRILPFLLTVLFLVLPFHALIITMVNHFFLEGDYPPPFFLKMWKEFLIIIIILIIGLKNSFKKFFYNFDTLDYLIVCFSFISLFISLYHFSQTTLHSFVYGIKYTLFPLWIFFCFRIISSLDFYNFLEKFQKFFFYSSAIIIFLGCIFFFIAQNTPKFFEYLGYSTHTSFHSIFQSLSYCQQISFTEICRAQSSFSGPNQLGAYLIFLLISFFSLYRKNMKKIFWVIFFSGIFLLFCTFSRSAWIGAIFSIIFFFIFSSSKNKSLILKKKILITKITFFFIFVVSIFSLFFPEIFSKILTRSSSSSQHYELSIKATKYIIDNPLGEGLGKAGAASKYDSQKGEKETGIIPENWYLQIGIETGIIGIILWIGIVFLVIKKLLQKNSKWNNTFPYYTYSPLSLASVIFGISIMGLFLHSWESSVVSYTIWGLSGIFLKK